jgi:hypothetical protein
MTIHYTVLAEVDRQRREQLAARIAATRRPKRQPRLRRWHHDHLHHPHPATHPVAPATA